MTAALEEKIARAICLSKQRHGDTDAVAAQYVDTFWRDYLPEARIAVSVLENGPAGLADANTKSPDPDLSSLRKGAEAAAIMEMFGRWQSGYAFDDDNDADVDLESRVEGEIAALVSGSREDGDG